MIFTIPKKPNLPNFEGWYATRSLSDDRKKSIKQLMDEAYAAGVADPYRAETTSTPPVVEIGVEIDSDAFRNTKGTLFINGRWITRDHIGVVNEMVKSITNALGGIGVVINLVRS